MNIWILTIGSSDVQLESKKTSRTKNRLDKQFSDQIWSKWAKNCEEDWEINFKPSQAFVDENETYRIPPRALGGVYNESTDTTQAEILSYLDFPLVNNFLKSFPSNPIPEAIFLILTDQSNLFTDSKQLRSPKCPYWNDTITLEAIVSHVLQTHFKENYNTEVRVEAIVLKPENQSQSLDDWNAVLELVQNEFRTLSIDEVQLETEKCDRVYVSHQAGTPAISSAVQFMSLATFRDSVYFLVSRDNQQFSHTPVEPFKLLPQSNYLGALRIQEAKVLLKRYDYTGGRDILGLTKATELKGNQKELKILLDAGEQWNFAEFHKFKNKLKQSKLVRVQQFPWWSAGYESAYLGIIRLNQENTVDCIFHSFRAVEGLLVKWIEKFHSNRFVEDGRKIDLGKEISVPWNPYRTTKVNSYGQGLYYAFLELANLQENLAPLDFQEFGRKVFKNRNNMFHKLDGAAGEESVFKFWEIPENEPEKIRAFENRVLICLNCISGQDFNSLEQASLMAQVHRELTKAIDSL